ncbi:MAG: hypothetical protein IJH34_17865 [Romboutsia sp.]|nr:hypothetical protein [Romboutsia sp.]
MNTLEIYKTNSEKFSNELIRYCKENNITAYKLSKYGNISMTYAYNLLNNRMKKPSLWIMKKITDGFIENQI